MSDSIINIIDKSHITNVSVTGNNNMVVNESKNTTINNGKDSKSSLHWLQIIYWIVGILLALISIYKFFIE